MRIFPAPIAVLAVLAISFVAVYYATLGHIANTWFSARGSYGVIIAGVSGYMVWLQRDTLKRLSAEPQLFWGSVVTATGCLVLLIGKLSFTLLVQYAAFLVTLFGLVLLIGGLPYLGVLGLPIAYLSFSFSFYSALLERWSDHLQSFTALIAFALLKLGGVPVLLSGWFIQLPTVSMEVARECSGVNHVVALVALAISLAFWAHRVWWKRVFLIAAAVVIAQFANGLRVAAIGYLSYYATGSRLHGPYDMLYVPFVFFFGAALVIGTSMLLSRGCKQGTADTEGRSSREGNEQEKRALTGHSLRPVIIAVLIFGLTGAFLFFTKPRPIVLTQPLNSLPLQFGEWTGSQADLRESPFTEFLADEEVKRVYTHESGKTIKLYVGYFPMQDDEKKVVGYRYDALQRNAETVSIQTFEGPMSVKRTLVQSGDRAEYVYFYYVVNNTVVLERADAKQSIIKGILHKRASAAAIVVLAHGINKTIAASEKMEAAMIADLMSRLKKQLSGKG